jgi:hypothetical protein
MPSNITRFRAVAIHLCLCVSIGAVLLALFWFLWYPVPLFRAVGGVEIFLMLLAIDVVLGPILTFVVFKSGKKTLKFDLTVIVFVQLVALSYGVFTLFAGRPVYVASLGDGFKLVQANEVEPQELQVAKTSLPLWGPKWVGTKKSSDPKENERVLLTGAVGGGYAHYPQHHAPLESMREVMLAKARPISELRIRNKSQDAEITEWLSSRGYDDQTATWQPLRARERMAVILDAKTAAVVGIAPFKPWD